MADITASSINEVLKAQLGAFKPSMESREVGTVVQIGDGIARVDGLANAMAGELLEFIGEGGHVVMGLALNLDEHEIGAVLMGETQLIKENDTVRSTGRVIEVPSGPAFLGRIVDPLGQPVDGKGPIPAEGRRPVEFRAPGVVSRQGVNEPLQTGIMAIDAMIPIGRGQRELIIGDRQTGKTSVAVDAIINQKGKDVICVYVAIGQKASTVAGVVQTCRPPRRSPRPCSTSPRSRAARWANISSTRARTASPRARTIRAARSCASTTTCPSRRSPTARCR
jgi:F-type H+-transporting ATPase subunit alpha